MTKKLTKMLERLHCYYLLYAQPPGRLKSEAEHPGRKLKLCELFVLGVSKTWGGVHLRMLFCGWG